MAEKYGTVPKRFTKEWWSWYWMYYKWHTIGTLFALLVIGVTTYSSLTAEKFDIVLTYAGKNYYADESVQKFEEKVSPLCKDIDGNGESSLLFSQLNIDYDSTDAQYITAMSTKLQVSLGEDETYLFILDEKNAKIYEGENAGESTFAPLEDWLTEDITGLGTYSAHGVEYGIKASDLKIFEDCGMDLSDHYLFMRYYPRKDQEEKHLKGYKASIELANNIISYK